MNINEVKQNVSENIFYDYNSEDVLERNAVEYHAMTGEHTEILGQFLDVTGMDVEDLKETMKDLEDLQLEDELVLEDAMEINFNDLI